MLLFDYSSSLHINGLGSCWQRWHCHRNCHALHVVPAQSSGHVITSHQRWEIWQHCGLNLLFLPLAAASGWFISYCAHQHSSISHAREPTIMMNIRKKDFTIIWFLKETYPNRKQFYLNETYLVSSLSLNFTWILFSMSAEHIHSLKQKNVKTKDKILFSWCHLVWTILSILLQFHLCIYAMI